MQSRSASNILPTQIARHVDGKAKLCGFATSPDPSHDVGSQLTTERTALAALPLGFGILMNAERNHATDHCADRRSENAK